MHLKRKLPWILTGKSLLAVGSIAMVALALVTYSATITITFSPFFTLGLNTSAWTTNTASGSRYLPGNTAVPGTPGPITATTTFAFSTITGGGYVQIGTSTAAKTTDFSSFKIFVLVFNSTTWNNATIYTTSAFSTVLSGGVDGTNTATSGFIHIVSAQPQTYFAIQVNYVLVGTPADTSANVVFAYTPSLN